MTLRHASNSNYAPSDFTTLSGTRLKQISRIAFWVPGDRSDLVLSFFNWITYVTSFILGGNAYTIEECALEKDGDTSSVPVMFGGSRTKVIAAGDTDIQSDPVLPADFSLSQFDDGIKMWIRLLVSVTTSGHQVPEGIAYNGIRGGSFPDWVGFAFDPSENTTVSDVDSYGPISLGDEVHFTNNPRPVTPIVLGTFVSGDPPTWNGFGDSIIDYSNDTLTGFGFAGFFARAMTNDSHDGSWVGGMDFGISGAKASVWTGTNAAKAMAYWAYGKFAVDEFGTNNFASSDSLGTTQDQAAALWALAYSEGIQGILRAKLLPRLSATSDAYQTESGQTKLAEFTTGGAADQFNTWLDTQIGAGLCTTVIDWPTVRGVDTWKWVVDGTSNYATSDGIHPSPAAHALMATTLRAAMNDAAYSSTFHVAWAASSNQVIQ